MKAVSPWSANTECPLEGFQEFKRALLDASYHHAGSQQEWKLAKACIQKATEIAIGQDWPYWVMDRMFREIAPLVEWSQFMQTYINTIKINVDNLVDEYRL
jgi:hypothetical protein